MRKTTILAVVSAVVCILSSGCGAGITISGDGFAVEVSQGIFNKHSTYFERYSSEREENTCRVRGTIHQAADDQNSGLILVTAEGGNGSMAVTGSMKCEKGNIRLIYIAPDGTETLIAEGTTRKMDVQVDVAEGEGEITFASDGESSVCTFDIKVEAGENVNFSDFMEEGESIENIEDTEKLKNTKNIEMPEVMEVPEAMETSEVMEVPEAMEAPEVTEAPEAAEAPERRKAKPDFTEENDKLEKPEKPLNEIDGLKSIGIEEIEDNWPENIRYHADGLYADPMTVTFQIDAPMTVSLVCKIRDGKLRLKLIGPDNSEKKVCFDETDPDGTYTVKLDRPGEYQALFYAEHHVGSVEIVPIEE